jgi:hypothetical protein
MATTRIQFGTKALLGTVMYAAVALGCLRNAFDTMASPPADVVRLVGAVWIGFACCFGISGIVVGWPVRGFLFGLLISAAAIFAIFMFYRY